MSADGVTPDTSATRKSRRERPTRTRRARTLLLPQLLAAAVELDPSREALRFEGGTHFPTPNWMRGRLAWLVC